MWPALDLEWEGFSRHVGSDDIADSQLTSPLEVGEEAEGGTEIIHQECHLGDFPVYDCPFKTALFSTSFFYNCHVQ